MISVSSDFFFLHLRLAMSGSYEYWRLVKVEIVLSAFTDAISRLFTILPVVVVRRAWSRISGIAVIRPKAVQFIASEILAASRAAFSAGLAEATAAGRDQTHDGAEQSEQGGILRQRSRVCFSNWRIFPIMLSSMALLCLPALLPPLASHPDRQHLREMAESLVNHIRGLSKSLSAPDALVPHLAVSDMTRFRWIQLDRNGDAIASTSKIGK
jgi:hypothetical protein